VRDLLLSRTGTWELGSLGPGIPGILISKYRQQGGWVGGLVWWLVFLWWWVGWLVGWLFGGSSGFGLDFGGWSTS
jgi:hypothetical protein